MGNDGEVPLTASIAVQYTCSVFWGLIPVVEELQYIWSGRFSELPAELSVLYMLSRTVIIFITNKNTGTSSHQNDLLDEVDDAYWHRQCSAAPWCSSEAFWAKFVAKWSVQQNSVVKFHDAQPRRSRIRMKCELRVMSVEWRLVPCMAAWDVHVLQWL